MLSADRLLYVQHSYIRRHFRVSCNSILTQCKYASEEVKLQLIKSFLPASINVLYWSSSTIKESD